MRILTDADWPLTPVTEIIPDLPAELADVLNSLHGIPYGQPSEKDEDNPPDTLPNSPDESPF